MSSSIHKLKAQLEIQKLEEDLQEDLQEAFANQYTWFDGPDDLYKYAKENKKKRQELQTKLDDHH